MAEPEAVAALEAEEGASLVMWLGLVSIALVKSQAIETEEVSTCACLHVIVTVEDPNQSK